MLPNNSSLFALLQVRASIDDFHFSARLFQLKGKNQVCYYGDDDGMLNWKKLRAVGLCGREVFLFQYSATNSKPKPQKQ